VEKVRAYVTVVIEFEHTEPWLPSRVAQEVQELLTANGTGVDGVRVLSRRFLNMDLSMEEVT